MDRLHSREPWRVFGSTVVCERGAGTSEIKGADDYVHYDGGELVGESLDGPDARRIVACVNVLAGVPTDELEMLARAGKTFTALGDAVLNEAIFPKTLQQVLRRSEKARYRLQRYMVGAASLVESLTEVLLEFAEENQRLSERNDELHRLLEARR